MSYYSSQLFIELVPWNIVQKLLILICPIITLDRVFMVDTNAFKKMIFLGYHHTFLETLKNYYHIEKHFYLTRRLTYNSFTTILRQLCKSHNISFRTELKFEHTYHNMVYFFPWIDTLE